MSESTPLQLHVNPDTKPVAVHKHVPGMFISVKSLSPIYEEKSCVWELVRKVLASHILTFPLKVSVSRPSHPMALAFAISGCIFSLGVTLHFYSRK